MRFKGYYPPFGVTPPGWEPLPLTLSWQENSEPPENFDVSTIRTYDTASLTTHIQEIKKSGISLSNSDTPNEVKKQNITTKSYLKELMLWNEQ